MTMNQSEQPGSANNNAEIKRLLSPQETLLCALIQAWHNRLEREIQILYAKQVDALKLDGLLALQKELAQAVRVFQLPAVLVSPLNQNET